MRRFCIFPRTSILAACALALACLSARAQQTDPNRVYRCPDNSYTNMLSVVRARHCKPVDNANISVVSPGAVKGGGHHPPPHPGSAAQRVEPSAQAARDAEARHLLEDELQSQQVRLQEQLKAYNGGHPDRLGGEANYQKYLDRVDAMKKSIDLTQSNIDALQRELQRYGH